MKMKRMTLPLSTQEVERIVGPRQALPPQVVGSALVWGKQMDGDENLWSPQPQGKIEPRDDDSIDCPTFPQRSISWTLGPVYSYTADLSPPPPSPPLSFLVEAMFNEESQQNILVHVDWSFRSR